MTNSIHQGVGSYLLLKAQSSSSFDYKMKGSFERIARDGTEGNTKTAFEQDFNAAYHNVLMWVITGNEAHAQISIEILNAYSNTLMSIISMPYTKEVIEKIRPEGMAVSCDNRGFGTLLFYSNQK